MKILKAAVFSLILPLFVCAAEDAPVRQSGDGVNTPRREGMRSRQFGPRGGMRNNARRMSMNPLKRFEAEDQIKSKFAAEYAAAEKELLAAIEKIEALAAKAKVTLPVSTENQIRKLRAKDPAAFAKIRENAGSNYFQSMSELAKLAQTHQIDLGIPQRIGRRSVPAARPAPHRERPQDLMRRLNKQYPEEMKKILPLRESNPQEFRRQIMDLERRSREAAAPAPAPAK